MNGSKITQTGDKSFPKYRTHFVNYIVDIFTKIYQTFENLF